MSRIFGELITLLEVDKRLASDGTETATTVLVRLPYVHPDIICGPIGEQESLVPYPFTLPYHVYMLATMNSVDLPSLRLTPVETKVLSGSVES